jgi:hypothetical protein
VPTVGSAGRSGSTSSKSDTNDDSNDDKRTLLLTRKRTCPTPATSGSYKRQNKALTRRKHTARQQKRTTLRERSFSGFLSDSPASETGSSDDSTKMRRSKESIIANENPHRRLRNRPRPITSRQSSVSYSRSNAQTLSSTHTASQASWTTRSFTEGASLGKTRWSVSDFAFRPLSDEEFFLTAFFRDCNGSGILSPSHAAKVLKNVVGQALELDDITIKLLGLDTWFLTSRVKYYSKIAGRKSGQSEPALPILPLSQLSDEDSDESLSDDDDNNSDKNEEYSSYIFDAPLSSTKHRRWSKEEDNRLRTLKAQGKPWNWICNQFSNRSRGAVQVRWHTKLRHEQV